MLVPRKAEALEYVRRLAMARLDDGYDIVEIADFLGVSTRSVYRWARLRESGGEFALARRPHSGRPPKLDTAQAATVLSWLNKSPCDFGFPTQRWTAGRVAELIGRHFGVRMNFRYLSDWLGRRHITPQIPRLVARERDEAEIRWWVTMLWPRIKKKRATPAQTSYLPMKAALSWLL
jgi:transposase